MQVPAPQAVTDNFRYDCFISYRRSDGTKIAQWLRRHLVAYHLPRSLASTHSTKLAVYLDTVYERATNDFFEQNIVPALEASRFLLVIATPDANRKRTDGTANWVDREIQNSSKHRSAATSLSCVLLGEFVVSKLDLFERRLPRTLRLLNSAPAGTSRRSVFRAICVCFLPCGSQV